MDTAILSVHILVCVILVILVLLQAGRDGMGVIFGGGSSNTFGSAGAGGLLTKLTATLAVIFVCTSLAYNIMTGTSDETSSLLNVQFEETTPAPAQSEAPAPAVEEKPAEAPVVEDKPAEAPVVEDKPAEAPVEADKATEETKPTESTEVAPQ